MFPLARHSAGLWYQLYGGFSLSGIEDLSVPRICDLSYLEQHDTLSSVKVLSYLGSKSYHTFTLFSHSSKHCSDKESWFQSSCRGKALEVWKICTLHLNIKRWFTAVVIVDHNVRRVTSLAMSKEGSQNSEIHCSESSARVDPSLGLLFIFRHLINPRL